MKGRTEKKRKKKKKQYYHHPLEKKGKMEKGEGACYFRKIPDQLWQKVTHFFIDVDTIFDEMK